MTSVLLKLADFNREAEGEHHVKTRAEVGGMSTSPGTPKMASQPPDTRGEAWNILLTALRETSPVDTSISDF